MADERVIAVVAGIEVPASLPASVPLPAPPVVFAQFVALRAAACVGADYSNLALLDATGTKLRLFHGSFLDPSIADRYTDFHLDAPYPIAVSAQSGNAVFLPDLQAYREQYPEILDDTIAAGIEATASLPLRRADGSPVGAIGFAWADPPIFDVKLENALRAVAELCTETVERAERYDAEHELIVALQRRLLDDIPELDGVSTSARYLPAGRSASIGGDWYEGVVLDESRVAVVVGDVTGHGMTAAADMALIRGVVTALLLTGVPVADVFTQVSSVLRKRSGLLLATAALVVIDTATDTLTFATAGHPPPLLLLPNRHVRTLDSANAPMIGVGTTRSIADTAPFPPGSQLVMYTDGLVERRNQPFLTGIELAATHLASLTTRLGPSELIGSLLDALLADTTAEDDIALVVVERNG